MRGAAEIADQLIRRYEGCSKKRRDGLIEAYICPAGYPTQGWGIVVPSLDVPPITQEMADSILAREIPRYMAQALSASPGLIAHPAKLGAITSFVFNLGIGRYKASTLRRKVDAQDWDGAADEFPKWVYGGGRKLSGLEKRRDTEREFFLL